MRNKTQKRRLVVPLLIAVCTLIVTCGNPLVTKITASLYEDTPVEDGGGETPVTPATFTVTFHINGGSGTTPTAQSGITPGDTIPLPGVGGLTRSGYTFGGWNTRQDGTGTNYDAGAPYTPTGNITLYAKWNTDPSQNSTVTFDINGGDGTPPTAQTGIIPGSSITLPTVGNLARTGHTFGGWNTNSGGTGTNYNAGVSYTPTGSITLYARWTPNTYTVTFNSNNGSGTVPAQTALYDTDITLPDGDSLTRTGYIFGGWNTSLDGTGDDYDENSSYTVNGNTTLYAKWIQTYTVTFNINGGSGTAPSPRTAPRNSAITLPSGLTRTGYTFGGWNTSSDGTGDNYGSSYTGNADIMLYARWTINQYTVTFNGNGGSGTVSAQTVDYGTSITLPSGGDPGRDGYTFEGWNSNSGGTGTDYAVGTNYQVIGTTTFYAKWSFDSSAYSVGETGPGGGIIFYISAAGFTVDGYTHPTDPDYSGNFPTYTAHYLEVAPESTEEKLPWGAYERDIPGLANFSVNTDPGFNIIGNGRRNTAIIVAYLATIPETDKAAQYCDNLTFGSKNDWFLPSLGELNKIEDSGIKGTLGLSADFHWSSSQVSANYAWDHRFYITTPDAGMPKESTSAKSGDQPSVRAIRAF